MKRHIHVLFIPLLLAAGTAQAEDQQRQRDRLRDPAIGIQLRQESQTQTQTQLQAREQEQIYGSQLMTPEERAAHRARMQTANTAQEREAIRLEHHKAMQERAKKMGVTLPDMPPAAGGGMGPGQGRGSGRGTGMGQGGGRP